MRSKKTSRPKLVVRRERKKIVERKTPFEIAVKMEWPQISQPTIARCVSCETRSRCLARCVPTPLARRYPNYWLGTAESFQQRTARGFLLGKTGLFARLILKWPLRSEAIMSAVWCSCSSSVSGVLPSPQGPLWLSMQLRTGSGRSVS